MSAKRVLLLFDFSISAYAAHYEVVHMLASNHLDVVMLVVGFRCRFPAPESLRPMAEELAEAYRRNGGSPVPCFSDDHPDAAVDHVLAHARFGWVVLGSELAPCTRRHDHVEWLVVEPAGGLRVQREIWPSLEPTSPGRCGIDTGLVEDIQQ